MPTVGVGEVTLPGPLDRLLPVGEVGDARPEEDLARVGDGVNVGGRS